MAHHAGFDTDSVEISLLTCSPHNEVYSIYGHSAIRVNNKATNEDIVFSYGVFNYKQPFFLIKFVFGLTDYELGIAPFAGFKEEYSKRGSEIFEQIINLTSAEKYRIIKALIVNSQPQNRVYRYNFLYNNCTTKARDIIESNIDGKILYPSSDHQFTYREMIHEYTKVDRWAEFGDDLCLGAKADIPTTTKQQHFLPDFLKDSFSKATVADKSSSQRQLVLATNVYKPACHIENTKHYALTPITIAILLLAISLALTIIEIKTNHSFRLWDAAMALVAGLSGIVITVLLFSQHPTTSTNLQVLILNPVPLFFIAKILKNKTTAFWNFNAAMIILFLIASLFQDYAEGMEFVALSLLIRNLVHIKFKGNRLYKHVDKI